MVLILRNHPLLLLPFLREKLKTVFPLKFPPGRKSGGTGWRMQDTHPLPGPLKFPQVYLRTKFGAEVAERILRGKRFSTTAQPEEAWQAFTPS